MKKVPGRPKFNALCRRIEELGGEEIVLEKVCEGWTQAKIGKMFDVSRHMVAKYLRKTPERAEKYKEAQKVAADAYNDKSVDVLEELKGVEGLRGAEVSLHRALSGRYAKQASIGNPEKYGEKSVLDVNVTVADLHLDAVRERSAQFLEKQRQRRLLEQGSEDGEASLDELLERAENRGLLAAAPVVEADYEIEEEGNDGD